MNLATVGLALWIGLVLWIWSLGPFRYGLMDLTTVYLVSWTGLAAVNLGTVSL